MKKLSTEHENAVRDVARQCNDANRANGRRV